MSRFQLVAAKRRTPNLIAVAGVMAFLLLLLLLPGARNAAIAADAPTDPTLSATLTSPNAQKDTEFGHSVAADGSYRVVGDPGESVNGIKAAGNADVYSASSGKLLHTLISPNAEENGGFGEVVAVSGKDVVVSAYYEAVNGIAEAGKVYIYGASSGRLLHTLTSPKPQAEGCFGISVAVRSKDVVVGAPAEAANKIAEAGKVYVFQASSGRLLHTLTSPKPAEGGGFGYSVAVGGKDVVVGAKTESEGKVGEAGKAYVYGASSGKLLQTLTSPTPQEDGFFGVSVAISGEDVVVGAENETADGYALAGKVYVYGASSGKLVRTLISPNAQVHGFFGASVAISGEDVVVGAYGETSGGGGAAAGYVLAGNAYVYSASSGKLLGTLTSPNAHEGESPNQGGEFGDSVAISGDSVLVGAKDETSQGLSEAGNAYLFSLGPTERGKTETPGTKAGKKGNG